MAKKKSAPRKTTRKNDTAKSKVSKRKTGAPPNEQDPQRRLGNFTGAGEHARQGGRTSGIVGQTKQRNRTDKKAKK